MYVSTSVILDVTRTISVEKSRGKSNDKNHTAKAKRTKAKRN